jgi:hypothetical protein
VTCNGKSFSHKHRPDLVRAAWLQGQQLADDPVVQLLTVGVGGPATARRPRRRNAGLGLFET